jgi:hypothetical protein
VEGSQAALAGSKRLPAMQGTRAAVGIGWGRTPGTPNDRGLR